LGRRYWSETRNKLSVIDSRGDERTERSDPQYFRSILGGLVRDCELVLSQAKSNMFDLVDCAFAVLPIFGLLL
jgi:hypothetical protein